MANNCYTVYKITGEPNVIHKLKESIEKLDNSNSSDTWWGLSLYDLAKSYGIDCVNEKIYCRGGIMYYEEDADDVGLLTVETDTAWSGCHDVFRAIGEKLGSTLSISYMEIEAGCGIYNIHDEGNFFPYEVYATEGGRFGDDEYYGEARDVILDWCAEMEYDPGDKSDTEMVKIINEWEYDCPDDYFYINYFKFQ